MKVPPRSYLAMQLALRRFLPLLPEFIFLLILFIFLPVLPHADALNTDNFNGSVRPSIESFFSLYNRRPICCVFRRDLSRVSNSYDSLGGNGGSSRLRVCGSRRNVCSACRAHARVSLSLPGRIDHIAAASNGSCSRRLLHADEEKRRDQKRRNFCVEKRSKSCAIAIDY